LKQTFLRSCFANSIRGNLRNRADGIGEIEGKAARIAASEMGIERVSTLRTKNCLGVLHGLPEKRRQVAALQSASR
jgi:hypothetical protein